MLKKLQLKGFGKHKEFKSDFSDGINAIVGRNQRGKTHIMESICYGLYGKTKNSKIDRIINFDMEKAEVELETSDFNLKRVRAKNSSKLSKVKKLELDKQLNLSYKEFLSIFYISSHDQNSLFDASYLRKFFISLFNLEKYSNKYNELRTELKTLKSVKETKKKVNKKLLKKRFNRVKKLVEEYKEKLKKYEESEDQLDEYYKKISDKRGEIRAKTSQAKKKINLVKQGKCPKCKRAFHDEDINGTINKCKDALNKINKVKKTLDKKESKLDKKQERLEKYISKYRDKVFQGRNILTVIKERSKEEGELVDKKRIKELEQIVPILSPKGFPSYLLKVYLPVITETTNNLLKTVFPNIKIKIRTEKPKSQKPDFKPIIYRKTGDTEEILEMKDVCGSECAVINICFRLGIMVIFKQLCNTCIDFMLLDESFEKIDNENSIKLMDLFENFIELGYLKQILLVTHKRVLKEQDNINYIELE